MNEKGNKIFWLGVFIIGALALATWLLLFLRPSFGDGNKELKMRFTNIEQVAVGTRVTYAGKAVGKVVAINQIVNARDLPTDANGDYYFYELVLKVDSSVKVYNSDQIIFTTTGLFGEKSIAILPKAPLQGQKAKEITSVTLYAEPSANLEQALKQLAHVAEAMESTLCSLDHFLTDNECEFKKMQLSLTKAADQITLFFSSANEVALVAQVKDTLSKISDVMDQTLKNDLISTLHEGLSEFRGMGEKLNSNELYSQVSTVVYELRQLISDINHYGLLFQYNKQWQRRQQQCCR